MFIRRTTIKSRESGERYYSYRLVESVRTATPGASSRCHAINGVRLRSASRPFWGGQLDLMADGLEAAWEALAAEFAARIIRRRGQTPPPGKPPPAGDFQRVDLDRVELIRPRSGGAEHVALEALRQLALDAKLCALGFNRHRGEHRVAQDPRLSLSRCQP